MYAVLRWRGVPRRRARNGATRGPGHAADAAGQRHGQPGRADRVLRPGRGGGGLGTVVDGRVLGDARADVRPGWNGSAWASASSACSGSTPAAAWRRRPMGMVALLVATLAWSFGSIWSRGRDLPTPFMAAAAQMLCGGAAMARRRPGHRRALRRRADATALPRSRTWSCSVRSSASPPTSGCCTTCARRWPAAMPTSIRRSRWPWARGWRRTLRRARTGGDGRDPAGRGRDHPGQGAQGRKPA
jgi:hypothetical protein